VSGVVFEEQNLEKVDYESPMQAVSIIHAKRNEQRSKTEEARGTFRIVGRIRGISRRTRTAPQLAELVSSGSSELVVRFNKVSIGRSQGPAVAFH